MTVENGSGRFKPYQDGKQKDGEGNHRESESNDEQVDRAFGEPGERKKQVSPDLNRQTAG